MGWDHYREITEPIDKLESFREHKRKDSVDELRISWIERRRLLRRVGYSDEELRKAEQESEKIRKQRERTTSGNVLQRMGRAVWPKSPRPVPKDAF
jgi:hypothetical protein